MDFLLSTVILGDSGGGGNYIFFIIIVLITVISKIISWYKNRETNTEGDDRSYDGASKNVQKAIRKTISEQQTWPQQEAALPSSSTPYEHDTSYSMPALPNSNTDIEQAQLHTNVETLAASIERDAQNAIDHAYSSAESSYKQTMEQLTNSTNKAKIIAQTALKKSVPALNAMELKTPGMLKKAVIMSEILAKPKGLKKD